MATTVDVIRFTVGYWASFPDIVEGCDLDLSIASAIDTFIEHGWAAVHEQWDVTADEADVLIDTGKYICGIVANPYDKPAIEVLGKMRHMVQSDEQLIADLLFVGDLPF